MSETICIVGSINMDLVIEVPRFPKPGETLRGGVLRTMPGGKAANQAVAVARLGGRAHLVGAVGGDAWGSELKSALRAEGLDVGGVSVCQDLSTGAGLIAVVPGGENAILVAPGANDAFLPEAVQEAQAWIGEAGLLLLQNEIPAASNLSAARLAKAHGTRVMLNAAPTQELCDEFLGLVDVLVVNEVEARQMTGSASDVSESGLARRLGALGPALVAVTMGNEGAVLFDGEELLRCPAFAVDSLDSTGAGDAFCGGLALSLLGGGRHGAALRFACAAGALATTSYGAMASQPTHAAVTALLG